MILTAGFNIYPAELERVIAGHADVALVAVGSIPDEEKGELAKACIIAKADASHLNSSVLHYIHNKYEKRVCVLDNFASRLAANGTRALILQLLTKAK